MNKKTFLLNILLCCGTTIQATTHPDSISVKADSTYRFCKKQTFGQRLDKISSSRAFQMTYIGTPLIIGGLLVKSEDDHFRSLRNDYMPTFKRPIDDYLQYAPAVAMLGMKLAGVEGRSSWKRMITSDIFSGLIMASAVNILKQSTQVERPDGSNRHSFPSGHTATAFMTATMLNKEYGHKSPWIGVGAYATASATGLLRMANNKHWLSDVLTGAGIGIISTELGYYLADLIFKDKGVRKTTESEIFDAKKAPSFIGMYLGFNVPLSHYDLDDQTTFRTSSGSTAGIEGAYFFNPYIGAGGRFTVSNTHIIVNGQTAENNTFDVLSYCVGPYFSYPISSRWQVGSKLLMEYVHYPQLKLTDISVNSNNGIGFGSGVSINYRAKEHFGFRLFLDYNLIPPHSSKSKEYMNTLTLGSAFVLSL